MATKNQVDVGLSGTTGTGTFVGSTSPTLVTPTIGAASATSISFSSTSGIIGTSAADNAAAGSVGEFVSSIILAVSAVPLTSPTPSDVTSISLTAGDWDVWGNVCFTGGGTTNVTLLAGWASSTSATLPDASITTQLSYPAAGVVPFANPLVFDVLTQRFSLAGTTTIYLSAEAIFSLSTCSAFGGIYARRRR